MERKAGRKLQTARVLLVAMFLGIAALSAVRGEWLITVLMLVGVGGAAAALRRGTYDPDVVRDHVIPRAQGGAVVLVCCLVVAALTAVFD